MDKSTGILPIPIAALVTLIIIMFSGLSTVTFGQSDAQDTNYFMYKGNGYKFILQEDEDCNAQEFSETVSYYTAEGYQSVLVYDISNTPTNATASSSLPVNKPPVIVVTSPISGEINQTVTINASISDPDGNITSIIWNQEDEFPPVNMNISLDKQSMSFIPKQNVTYVFSIEAVDNNGSTTLKSAQVNVGS
jgi:K319L-like, PKD domain